MPSTSCPTATSSSFHFSTCVVIDICIDYLTADHHDLLVDMFCWMASHESDVTEPEQIPVQTQVR